MRVATAADRLGYESEASLSRAFKRVIGHTPSAARGGVGEKRISLQSGIVISTRCI